MPKLCPLSDPLILIRRISKINYSSQSISFDGLCREYGLFRGGVADPQQIPWTNLHLQRFSDYARKYNNGGFLAEILTALQTAIQDICENIVLLDKVQYVSELEVTGVSCRIEKITDDELSPRCYALILDKKE